MKLYRQIPIYIFLLVLLTCGFPINARQPTQISGTNFHIKFDTRKGLYSIKHNNKLLVYNARLEIKMEDGIIKSSDKGIQFKSVNETFSDPLGSGKMMKVFMGFPGIDATIQFKIYDSKDLMTIYVDLINNSGEDIPLQEIRPIVVDGTESSNLKIDDKIEGTRLLTMGYSFVDSGELMFLNNQHFDYSSNCNIAFYVPEKSIGLTIGSLNFDQTETQVYLRNDPKKFANGEFPGYGLKVACSTNKEGSSLYRYKKTDQHSSMVTKDNFNIEVDYWMSDDSTERYNEYLLRKGATISSGPIAFIFDKDPNTTLEKWADYFHDFNDVKLNSNLPIGWSSWPDLYYNIDEVKMLRVCDFIVDQHLPDFGFDMIQIDDGFQEKYGDWEGNLYFPHGMKWLADEIKKRGLRPGIWLAPYAFSINTDEALNHKDWMFHYKEVDSAQTIPYYLGIPVYCMDVSIPESQDWLDSMYSTISNDWGYEMIKLDFILHSVAEGNQFADRYMTKAEAYRKGLMISKNALGEDGYLLECGIMTAAGVTDGWRTNRDIEAAWNELTMEHGTGYSTPKHYYMNGKLFNTDADHLVVREDRGLTLDQARVLATNVAMGGSQVLAGDEFYKLPDERLQIIKSVIPPYGKPARSVDLFEVNQPAINSLHIKNGFEDWWVISVTNWTDESQEKSIDLIKAGLDKDQKYLAYEFWEQDFIGEVSNELMLNLKPTSSKVIAFRKKLNRPQIIGTDRHILQGAVELENVEWDPKTKQISGRLLGAREHVFNVMVHVPIGFEILRISVEGKEVNAESISNNLIAVPIDFDDRKIGAFSLTFD